MSETLKMLKRIIADNGNFISREKAIECVPEMESLQSRIELLEKVVKRQGEAIDWYSHIGNINDGVQLEDHPRIDMSGLTFFPIWAEDFCGKLARQVKQECEEMMNTKDKA